MATLASTHSGKQQQVLVEVNASAKPSEVVGAVIAGAQGARAASNPNRGIQFAFVFIIIFAVTIYFREELWSISRDVSKHPIMGVAEQLQISHYLGSKWLFGSGKDVTGEELEVVKQISAAEPTLEAGSNPVAAGPPSGTNSSSSAATTTAAASQGSTKEAAAGQTAAATGAADAKKAVDATALQTAGGSSASTGQAAGKSGATARKSWARRLLTVRHSSKCDNSNAKLLMRRLLMLAHRQRHVRG